MAPDALRSVLVNKRKEPIVCVSSTDDQSDSDVEGSGSDSDDNYDDAGEASEEYDPLEDDISSGGTSDGGGGDDVIDDQDRSRRVVDLLKCSKGLHTLKLEDCKAYLRVHGLRLSGNKATCIERICQHWRLKDGQAEMLYPRSSFTINCTGDVCKGDVILFKQRVYETFDIITRGGNIIGIRTIAGRVVKESYGSAKQQHTFTVEVLWCKGVKALPPLFALLVKGRNLYRMRTFRQSWSNENERRGILAEKHKRGAAARQLRAIKSARFESRGEKHQRNSVKIRSLSGKRQNTGPTHIESEKMQINRKNHYIDPDGIHKEIDKRIARSIASHPYPGGQFHSRPLFSSNGESHWTSRLPSCVGSRFDLHVPVYPQTANTASHSFDPSVSRQNSRGMHFERWGRP